jgi:hypothetical protein
MDWKKDTYTIGNNLSVSIRAKYKSSISMQNLEDATPRTINNSSQVLHVSYIIVVRAAGWTDLGEDFITQPRHDGGVHCEEVDDERHGGGGCVTPG